MSLQTASTLDVRHFLNGHMVDVFETMLSMKATPVSDTSPPEFTDRTTGAVGFGGENVSGAVYLHLSTKMANQIAAGMLGLPDGETPTESDANDVVGECTNMIAGGLKSALCDKGFECAMSTPAIIRGISFAIESRPDVRHELLVFECNGSRLAIELHIKYNQTA